MAQAILLLSGGLDSVLAGKLLLSIGVDVEAVNFVSPFCCCTPKSLGCPAGRKAAEQLGIPVKMLSCGADYLEIVKNPRFGRGRGMNPCLDCRIFMFSRARAYMLERGADFIATGEVLGQRPMSQHREAMALIEREAGLEGLVVRPLCARRLPPSLPEQNGLIDRNQLKAMRGRSRQGQFALATDLGITDYLCPAGGCLLTDLEFAARVRDLLEHEPGFGVGDVRLLRVGRHFRLGSGAKVIVGRNQEENDTVEDVVRAGDVLLVPQRVPGPSVLCRGMTARADLEEAARILAAYTKGTHPVDVEIRRSGKSENDEVLLAVASPDRATTACWRVGA